jgi:hypothetical protein
MKKVNFGQQEFIFTKNSIFVLKFFSKQFSHHRGKNSFFKKYFDFKKFSRKIFPSDDFSSSISSKNVKKHDFSTFLKVPTFCWKKGQNVTLTYKNPGWRCQLCHCLVCRIWSIFRVFGFWRKKVDFDVIKIEILS